mmetsp:Transcript_25137/g.62234  ORF Transcript_25137/g.62234 Transcript_25137/m.62234 type:complete len:287 (+) Transcript_25137:521-1381(+)
MHTCMGGSVGRSVCLSVCLESDCWKSAGEFLDFLPQLCHGRRLLSADVLDEIDQLGTCALLHIECDVDRIADVLANLFEVGFHQTPRRHRRRTDSDSIWVHSAFVSWYGVFVDGDVDKLADLLGLGAAQALGPQVNQYQMVVRATGHQVETPCHELLAHSHRVFLDLLLVLTELGRRRLFQCDGECSDDVVVWAALHARKHRSVDLVLYVIHYRLSLLVDALLPLPIEDHGPPGPPQALVCGRRHHIAVVKRRRHHSRRHQTRYVCHVGHQPRVAVVGHLSESFVV